MKAIALLAGLAVTVVLAGCAAKPPPPAPAPPVARPSPAPRPTLAPAPTPLANWRDLPITPGTWTWGVVDGRSTARFGQPGQSPLIELRCDRVRGEVTLAHRGTALGLVPMTLVTTHGNFPLTGDPAAAGTGWIAAAIPARARSLDAMAYSRGRFAIEVAGLAPARLPAWPEVARVIEDCR